MTTVVISRFRLTAMGHAGKNVICAGVSTLTQMLAQEILIAHNKGWLKEPPVVIVQKGNVQLRCKPKLIHEAEMLYLWGAVADGLKMIADAYPDNVVIKSALPD